MMRILIRFFTGKQDQPVGKIACPITEFDSDEMVRVSERKYLLTNSCSEAEKLLKEDNDAIIVIALIPGNPDQAEHARQLQFYYASKLLICHVLELPDFEAADCILFNAPTALLKKIEEQEAE